MNHSNHFSFATKVWLISVFLSPVLTGMYIGITDGNLSDSFGIAGLMIPFGLVFSIPNWLIFIFIVYRINQLQLDVTDKKILINLNALILTITLFIIISYVFFYFEPELLVFTLPYCASLTLGIWKCDLIAPIPSEQKKVLTPNGGFLEDILDDENY